MEVRSQTLFVWKTPGFIHHPKTDSKGLIKHYEDMMFVVGVVTYDDIITIFIPKYFVIFFE